jgi:hypothetical protein
MKNEDVENLLNSMPIPEPEKIIQHQQLKIPLLSYRRSSKAGLWLLLLPITVAITIILKNTFGFQSGYINLVRKSFSAIDKNVVLTYLIPLIFVGLPLVAMIINMLAICHFHKNNQEKELLITIKYRPLNIAVFLFSFAVLIFFLWPDRLSFN